MELSWRIHTCDLYRAECRNTRPVRVTVKAIVQAIHVNRVTVDNCGHLAITNARSEARV